MPVSFYFGISVDIRKFNIAEAGTNASLLAVSRHFMETLKHLDKFTKTTLITGLTLVIYGYLARLVGLYFLWESKSIGWTILFIGVVGFLSNRIKLKKSEKKKVVLEKIGIGLIVFILFVQTLLMVIIPFTDAYSVAKSYVKNDSIIKSQLGDIIGFGLIPTGSIQKTTDSSGDYGNATINLTIKGYKKYMDATIFVVKYADMTAWNVEEIQQQ